jgi:toxin ParE1/3/4
VADVRLSAQARSDFDSIMDYLDHAGGVAVTERYRLDFVAAFERLAAFPGSGSPRPKLGAHVRLLVIKPYSIYYEGRPKGSTVLVLRVVRGRRRATRKLLAEGREG